MPAGRLPLLNFDTPITAATAKQDKIELSVDHGFICDPAEDVANFLHFLGTPPVRHRDIEPSPFGQIFTRPRRLEPPFAEQSIRRGHLSAGSLPMPLFGGKLKISPARTENSLWRLQSLLSLNPTRFVRHQAFSARRLILENDSSFTYRVFRDAELSCPADEFAYCGNDNWIPDNRFWFAYTAPQFWSRHLSAYLSGTVNAINDDLHRAAELQTVTVLPPTEFPVSLHSVETYWEFYSEAPLEAVRAMQPVFQAFAAAPLVVSEHSVEPSTEMEQNSLCLKLQSRNGEVVKIYAKTNRRVRFEVVHRLSGNRPMILPSGHTFPSVESASRCIWHLATVAEATVNQLLRFFQSRHSVPVNQYGILKFISEIQAACATPEQAYELLTLLVNNSSVVVGPGIPMRSIFGPALSCLKRRGVLETSHRRYSVRPAYSHALRTMQGSGIALMLDPRRRTRRRSP